MKNGWTEEIDRLKKIIEALEKENRELKAQIRYLEEVSGG